MLKIHCYTDTWSFHPNLPKHYKMSMKTNSSTDLHDRNLCVPLGLWFQEVPKTAEAHRRVLMGRQDHPYHPPEAYKHFRKCFKKKQFKDSSFLGGIFEVLWLLLKCYFGHAHVFPCYLALLIGMLVQGLNLACHTGFSFLNNTNLT